MSRALRIEFPGAIYHVMSRGVDRGRTFLSDGDRRLFLARIGRFVKKGVLVVHAFCLMDNHFHLLCETPAAGLSRWMQGVLGPYAQGLNLRRRRVGPLWQRRYKAILVEDGVYFLNCSSYIHRNAPDAGVCQTPEEHPWSSWGAFCGSACPVDWVAKERTLGPFDSPEDYRRFVLSRLGSPSPDPFQEAAAGIAYGGESFVRAVLNLVKDRPPDAEIPSLGALRRLADPGPDAALIEGLVQEIFSRRSPCQRRRILVFALSRQTRLTGKQISLAAGLTPSAVTMARRAIASRISRDPELAAGLLALAQRLESPPP